MSVHFCVRRAATAASVEIQGEYPLNPWWIRHTGRHNFRVGEGRLQIGREFGRGAVCDAGRRANSRDTETGTDGLRSCYSPCFLVGFCEGVDDTVCDSCSTWNRRERNWGPCTHRCHVHVALLATRRGTWWDTLGYTRRAVSTAARVTAANFFSGQPQTSPQTFVSGQQLPLIQVLPPSQVGE